MAVEGIPPPPRETPPDASERASAALTVDSVPIPATCLVTGGRTCHRRGCYHERGDGRCSLPRGGCRRSQAAQPSETLGGAGRSPDVPAPSLSGADPAQIAVRMPIT